MEASDSLPIFRLNAIDRTTYDVDFTPPKRPSGLPIVKYHQPPQFESLIQSGYKKARQCSRRLFNPLSVDRSPALGFGSSNTPWKVRLLAKEFPDLAFDEEENEEPGDEHADKEELRVDEAVSTEEFQSVSRHLGSKSRV